MVVEKDGVDTTVGRSLVGVAYNLGYDLEILNVKLVGTVMLDLKITRGYSSRLLACKLDLRTDNIDKNHEPSRSVGLYDEIDAAGQ